MLPTQRNLDGIYFRIKNPDTDSYENRCFTDLTEELQHEMIQNKSKQWLESLALILAKTLRRVGDELDLELVDEED